jgi:hypothetical protein
MKLLEYLSFWDEVSANLWVTDTFVYKMMKRTTYKWGNANGEEPDNVLCRKTEISIYANREWAEDCGVMVIDEDDTIIRIVLKDDLKMVHAQPFMDVWVAHQDSPKPEFKDEQYIIYDLKGS